MTRFRRVAGHCVGEGEGGRGGGGGGEGRGCESMEAILKVCEGVIIASTG